MRKRKIKEFRFTKRTKMTDLIGHFGETNQRVGDFSQGHQFIILKPLDKSGDPLFLIEQRGRVGSVHLTEMTVFELKAEGVTKNEKTDKTITPPANDVPKKRVLWKEAKKKIGAFDHIRVSLNGEHDTAKCIHCQEERDLEFNGRTRQSLLLETARKHYYRHKLDIVQTITEKI